MRLQGGDRLLSVGDLEDAEVMLQHIDQKGAVQLRIVCDQDLFLIHVLSPLLRFSLLPRIMLTTDSD